MEQTLRVAAGTSEAPAARTGRDGTGSAAMERQRAVLALNESLEALRQGRASGSVE
jgi:hypothetical protein